MVRAVDKADAMLTLSSAREPFTIYHFCDVSVILLQFCYINRNLEERTTLDNVLLAAMDGREGFNIVWSVSVVYPSRV